MKRFIPGIILGFIISTAAYSFATGNWENISVLRNDITVVVDGETLSSDNFLYNDTTYLPIRAIGEALDKEVLYNEETNTAIIQDKGEDSISTTGNDLNKYEVPEELKRAVSVVDGINYLSSTSIHNIFGGTNNELLEDYATSAHDPTDLVFIFTLADGTTKTLPTIYFESIGRSCITYDTFVEEIMPHM